MSRIQASDSQAPRPTHLWHGVWRAILDDARWAPSPHNTQPWLVRLLSPEAAELYAPRERLLPVEDPEGRFQAAEQGIDVDLRTGPDLACDPHSRKA